MYNVACDGCCFSAVRQQELWQQWGFGSGCVTCVPRVPDLAAVIYCVRAAPHQWPSALHTQLMLDHDGVVYMAEDLVLRHTRNPCASLWNPL
jgi:hypothetical protein